jgi:hypothetical protein
MKITRRLMVRATTIIVLMLCVSIASNRLQADMGTCGGVSVTLPFVDVPAGNVFFCSIAGAFFSGLANGTDATHYNPSDSVPREQMAAFVSRTMDQSLKRGSTRAALGQFWTPKTQSDITLTTVGNGPEYPTFDGADVWVPNVSGGSVTRVRASDGKVLETWTGAGSAHSVLIARGKVFVTGNASGNGRLYQLDPSQPAGSVTTLTTSLAAFTAGIAYDGQRIWTADQGDAVSIITLNPLTVTNVNLGASTSPYQIAYDGSNMWVTCGNSTVKKLDSNGAVLLSVPMQCCPEGILFDGTNIWVTQWNFPAALYVIRATGALSGTVMAILTGNGMNGARNLAFDGERIMVVNSAGDSVSLWKASDFTPLGSVSMGAGTEPRGVCSAGPNFFVTLIVANKLARF